VASLRRVGSLPPCPRPLVMPRSHAPKNEFALWITQLSVPCRVLGSLAGGSATVATTRVTQRTLGKRELLRAEIKNA
jgi:hypothetical protein